MIKHYSPNAFPEPPLTSLGNYSFSADLLQVPFLYRIQVKKEIDLAELQRKREVQAQVAARRSAKVKESRANTKQLVLSLLSGDAAGSSVTTLAHMTEKSKCHMSSIILELESEGLLTVIKGGKGYAAKCFLSDKTT